MSTQTISRSRIRLDGGTQPRTDINVAMVAEYAQSMRDCDEFPPVILYFDGIDYWLADGFHRYHAAGTNGLESIAAYVRPGTQRDAVLCSVGANAAHGARRTNADKRKAVMTLLSDAEWSQWSDREIARRCAVGYDLVARLRPESLPDSDSEPKRTTYTTKHGTVATMNTENIGSTSRSELVRDADVEIERRLRAGEKVRDIATAMKTSPRRVTAVRVAAGIDFFDKSREAVQRRQQQIREMAADGYSVPQIAEATGLTPAAVSSLAKKLGVDMTAAKVSGKGHRHDSNRIIEHIVMDAENLTADTGLITFSALDRARLSAWIDSLVQSRRSLDALIKVLKETANG